MFAYQAMSEEEAMAERFQLIKEGEYDAIISASQDKVSSSGNDMMDMTVTVFDAEGKAHEVRDFLVFMKAMMWKIVHCAGSAGMMPTYQAGKLCSETITGKRVRVKVGIDAGKPIPEDRLNGKPFGSCYPDKNKIEDYLKRDNVAQPTANVVPIPKFQEDVLDDDVPF